MRLVSAVWEEGDWVVSLDVDPGFTAAVVRRGGVVVGVFNPVAGVVGDVDVCGWPESVRCVWFGAVGRVRGAVSGGSGGLLVSGVLECAVCFRGVLGDLVSVFDEVLVLCDGGGLEALVGEFGSVFNLLYSLIYRVSCRRLGGVVSGGGVFFSSGRWCVGGSGSGGLVG